MSGIKISARKRPGRTCIPGRTSSTSGATSPSRVPGHQSQESDEQDRPRTDERIIGTGST
eukprot:1145851-Rhodomonas_salina.1